MSKQLKLTLALALAAAITLPVLAQDTNTNVNANTNVNGNVNAPVVKPFKARPVFFNKAILKTIDGQTLTVTVKDKIYTVNVTDKTKLLRKYGAKSNLGEFAVGNSLQIYGKRTAETVVQASLIRNSSIEKKHGTFLGTIESLDSSAQKFVLKPVSRAKVTVTVLADTKIMYKSKAQTFADLVVGSKLAVSGMWDKSNNTVTEVTKIVVIGLLKTAPVKPAPVSSGAQTGPVTINMTASGFSPAEVKVVKGVVVTFTNQDSNPHWPASAVHPTHTLYPGFDALKGLNQGESWSFTFNNVGTWAYHDHLNPGVRGKVTVVESATTTGN
ncbi:MAG: cupredoxin domain-containing protein [Candidatus Kerfeldbacteria bacterium]|nr:cupredoxin domain-containing protein [Candidatus Kerfeldbacteria bacterium]